MGEIIGTILITAAVVWLVVLLCRVSPRHDCADEYRPSRNYGPGWYILEVDEKGLLTLFDYRMFDTEEQAWNVSLRYAGPELNLMVMRWDGQRWIGR